MSIRPSGRAQLAEISPKSILVVVQRPDWTDTACHWGQHWMKEYVTKPAIEAGFEVVDLYGDDAIRSKVLEACNHPNFTYFSGDGHGSATTFTGQRRERIFWKGDKETKAVSNRNHFNFLSCVFGREGAKWMQEEGEAIGVHGYDDSFIFVIDRRDFPNEYAYPFFDSHATVDRELFKGATHGEAHQACLDRFEYWIENAPEVCRRYLAWDKEHKVFWGDPQARISPPKAPSFWEILLRWIRRLLRFLGFRKVEKKRTYGWALTKAGKMPEDIEEGLSRVEATLQGIKSSIDLTNERIDDLGDALRNDISENLAEIRDLRGRLWWIMGILFSMWVTIILTILLRR